MIKINNNSDTLLISHISDVDGMGSVIISKLIGNFDIVLLSIEEVRDFLNSLIGNNYKQIYMCDLSIPDDLADIVNDNIKNILHFDHHMSNMYVSKYKWSFVIPEFNGYKPCGTSLFYDYLLTLSDNQILHSLKTKQFVEAVRSNDTWDFKDNNYLGKYLTLLFSMYGEIKFIDTFYERLKDSNENFELSETEKSLIEIKLKEMDNYIELADKNLIKTKFLNYNVGITISELFRSELGNRLSLKYKDELDFILIVDFHRKSYSTRTVNNIDLGSICKSLGGGGHKKAAGFPMNSENNKIIFEIIKDNLSL